MTDTWVTSDWHIGHANILKYCFRPFPNVDEMNEELIARHNALVKPNDLVIDVGDFTMSDRYVEPTLRRLHGRRILVPGNHDRCYRKHRSSAFFTRKYLEWGFAEIHQQWEMNIAGKRVLIDHMPYTEDISRHVKYAEFRPKDRGLWLLHGHVHGAWAQRGRMINVGVDVRDYRPMHLDEVAKLIS